jgi:D-aminoacyl-tRNA deacylase
MKVLVQRVAHASVTVGDEVTGQIGPGLLVFLGVEPDDTDSVSAWYVDKVHGLRIFSDSQGHMNLSVADVGGAVLVVSQFTLAGSTRKGRRPSFEGAASPELGERLYLRFVEQMREKGIPTETGRFRADMKVSLLNDGPVTFMIDPPKEP